MRPMGSRTDVAIAPGRLTGGACTDGEARREKRDRRTDNARYRTDIRPIPSAPDADAPDDGTARHRASVSAGELHVGRATHLSGPQLSWWPSHGMICGIHDLASHFGCHPQAFNGGDLNSHRATYATEVRQERLRAGVGDQGQQPNGGGTVGTRGTAGADSVRTRSGHCGAGSMPREPWVCSESAAQMYLSDDGWKAST